MDSTSKSVAWSESRLSRMLDVMAGYVERAEIPGLVTLVSRHGETHVNAIGRKANGGSAPIRRDTIFRVASMTKPVTGVAAMILVEECKVRLDDPVDRFLPELANRRVLTRIGAALDDTVPANRPITLRDLLTLRMGLGYLMTEQNLPIQGALREHGVLQGPPQPQSLPAPDEWMRRVGLLPLMHQPGEHWMYDLGLDLAGVMVARVSGKPFDVFLQERIFGPLEMKDTAFHVSPDKINRLATSYWTNFETGAFEVYDAAAGGDWSKPPAFPAGSGGLVSTADDFLAFGQMMLNKGKLGDTRILSRRSVEAMTQDQLTPSQREGTEVFLGENRGWGLGLSVLTRSDNGARNVGAFGWDGGLGTSWYVDPTESLIGILLTQAAWLGPTAPKVCDDFWTLAYQAMEC